MSMKTIRRARCAARRVAALGTLLLFWNGLLQASFAAAQNGESRASHLEAVTSPPVATYDAESIDALSSHLEGAAAAEGGETGEASPQDLSDIDRALAALPTGGGAISPQAAAMPGGAATQLGMGESFSMQLSTGTAGYSVPIALPAARGRVQPSLDLSYSAGGGFGLAGVGWSIGAAAISRQTDRGTPGYDDRGAWHPEQDRFVFGAMELVPICTVTSGSCTGALLGERMPAWANGWQYFRARVETSFLRFFWSADHRTWRIQGKDGTNMELGVPLDGSGYVGGLESNPEDDREIFRWHLTRQYDSQGNANAASGPAPVNVIAYRHLSDGNTVYLSDIFDTPPASAPTTTNLALFAHHTALHYEARPDEAASYRAGWLSEHKLRVARIDVTSKPYTGGTSAARELLRRYHFGYDPDSHRSLLTSVQMEGRCASPVLESMAQVLPLTSCDRLPAVRFEYQRVAGSAAPLLDAQGFAFDHFDTSVRSLANSPPHSLDEARTDLTDINADGLPDVLVTAAGLFRGQHGVYFNGLDEAGLRGFGDPRAMAVQPAADVVDADVLSLDSPTVSALDLDADGIMDLVHMPRKRSYSVFSPRPTTPNGQTFEWVGREIATASGQDVKIDFTSNAPNVRVMDVNSDGLVDIVFSSATEVQTFFSLGRFPGGDGQFGHARWTGADEAELSNDPVVHHIPWSSTPVRFSDPDTRLADMNGDGLTDFVRVRSGQLLYWPGRGNGFWGTGDRADSAGAGFVEDRHVVMDNAPVFGTVHAGTLLLSDVNGDGLSDMVEVRNQDVDIYLNDNGRGWTARHVIDHTPFRPSDSNYVRLTDIDGSGTPDILWGRAREYKYIDLTGGQTPHLLTKVHSGLGKTAELEYESATDHMLAAEQAGRPWTTRAPTASTVLVRTTVRDNLERIGRAPGAYVTEYQYRDPVYEGRQREFRGFREVTVTSPGDAYGPTSLQRTVFQLGECPESYAGTSADVCEPAERWQDNWREALKGLPVVNETFDAAGTYLSTEHTSYELRQLYTGRDGRRVVAPFTTGREAFLYDTTNFTGAPSSISLPEVVINLNDIQLAESRQLTMRASAGTARIRSTTSHDNFGNNTGSVRFGCVSGCPKGSVDEAISVQSEFQVHELDSSGWLWRDYHSWVQGSIQTARRNEVVRVFNRRGDVEETYAELSGSVALDRFHSSGGAIAPTPTDQSGGQGTASVQILVDDQSYDSFGNVTFTRGANARCSANDFDADYMQLATAARIYVGALNTMTGCGATALSNTVAWDRGLEMVVDSVAPTQQNARFTYDGLGRVVSATYAKDTLEGRPPQQPLPPSLTVTYTLPADPEVTPYSTTVISVQDGADNTVGSYATTWKFTDGLGRTFVHLTPADPSAGDGGNWIVQGESVYNAKGEVFRAHDPWFYNGTAQTYPLGDEATSPSKTREYDAFGRMIRAYNYDVQVEALIVHHALSADAYDAADVLMTAHQNTFVTKVSDGHGRTVQNTERIKVGGNLELRHVVHEHLPTGEVAFMRLRRAGSTDVVRWAKYDSLGRMVQNTEPNTTQSFGADPNSPPTGMKTIRYAYNNAGDMVGFSDARGCGANYHYDTSGRLLAEDRSPCRPEHAVYSAPNLATGDGTEDYYRYDVADPDNASIASSIPSFTIDSAQLLGRLVSVSSLGAKAVFRYDAIGRSSGAAVRMPIPGVASATLASRYAPRWYARTQSFDVLDRPTIVSTGATLPELLGGDGTSQLRLSYSKRGLVRQVGSSYGVLVDSSVTLADGRVQEFKLGDAAGTERYFSYDVNHRMQAVQTYRGNLALWSSPPVGSPYTPPSPLDDPTRQLLLEDYEMTRDVVGNITRIDDHRLAADWPATAKPVTRTFEYDDLYRLTRAGYEYQGGTPDTWRSPFDRENTDATRPQPVPHVSFAARMTEQRYQYDWLGNVTQSTDDQSAFYDRSNGDRTHGSVSAGPHRVQSASNRTLAPSSTRKGDLSVDWDVGGNLVGMIIRRDGACLPASASCWQRFAYEWNEVGELSRARRWDLVGAERMNHGQTFAQAFPARAANVELRYAYALGERTLKTAVDALGAQRHTAYVFNSLELRSTTWSGSDYVLNAQTASLRIAVGPIVARVVHATSMPSTISGSNQHLFLQLPGLAGSNSFLIDHATSELVEASTYQAYGAAETDYRPNRWQGYREPYKFSGKEEDIEVGLVYFGARYYSPQLAIFVSPDPVTIHNLGSDPNPYAYVLGSPTMGVDPDGRLAILDRLGDAIGNVVGGVADAAGSVANGALNTIQSAWSFAGQAAGAIAGAMYSAASAAAGFAVAGIQQIGKTSLMLARGAAQLISSAGQMAVRAVVRTVTGIASAIATGVKAGLNAISRLGSQAIRAVKNAAVAIWNSRALEAIALSALGSARGALVLGPVGAVLGGIGGALSGFRGIYNWENGSGFAALASDTTWGAVGATLGDGANVINSVSAADYRAEWSERQNRTVFTDGTAFQGKALTLGSTIAHWDSDGFDGEYGQKLLAHESEHITTSRAFGPLYESTYVGWMTTMAPIATVLWGMSQMSPGKQKWHLGNALDGFCYQSNPWESHAYKHNNPSSIEDNDNRYILPYAQ